MESQKDESETTAQRMEGMDLWARQTRKIFLDIETERERNQGMDPGNLEISRTEKLDLVSDRLTECYCNITVAVALLLTRGVVGGRF